MPTVASVAETIARQLGEEYTDLDIQDLFDQFVLEIIDDIFAEDTWPWSRSVQTLATVASQANYTLDDNSGDILEVRNTGGNRLVLARTTEEELIDSGFDMALESEPSHYYPRGRSGDQPVYFLWPIPDAVYNYSILSAIDSSNIVRTDTFPMSDDMIIVVRSGVRWLYRQHEENYNGADRDERTYRQRVIKAKAKHLQPDGRHYEFAESDIRGAARLAKFIRFPRNVTP